MKLCFAPIFLRFTWVTIVFAMGYTSFEPLLSMGVSSLRLWWGWDSAWAEHCTTYVRLDTSCSIAHPVGLSIIYWVLIVYIEQTMEATQTAGSLLPYLLLYSPPSPYQSNKDPSHWSHIPNYRLLLTD